MENSVDLQDTPNENCYIHPLKNNKPLQTAHSNYTQNYKGTPQLCIVAISAPRRLLIASEAQPHSSYRQLVCLCRSSVARLRDLSFIS